MDNIGCLDSSSRRNGGPLTVTALMKPSPATADLLAATEGCYPYELHRGHGRPKTRTGATPSINPPSRGGR